MFPWEYCKNFKNTYFAEHLRTTASKPINFLLPASISYKVIWNWVEIFWINLFSVYHQSQLVSTYWWSKKGIHYIKLKILKIKAYTEKNTTIFCIRSCFYVVQLIFRYLDCQNASCISRSFTYKFNLFFQILFVSLSIYICIYLSHKSI